MTGPALASRADETLSSERETLSSSSSEMPLSYTPAPPLYTPGPASSTPAFLDYTPGHDPDAMVCEEPPALSTPAREPPRDAGSSRARSDTAAVSSGDSAPARSEVREPGSGASPTAGGGSPAERADTPAIAASGAAARRPQAGGRQRQSHETEGDANQRRQRDRTLRSLAMPPAIAARGATRIGRDPLFLIPPSRTWSAPRTLNAPLPQPQGDAAARARGQSGTEGDPGAARAAYATAAGQSEALFDRILAAAARLASEANGQLQTLTDRAESQLGLALSQLETDHARRMVDAARGRDAALERIATRSDILRAYVIEQANRALSRMAAIRQEIETLCTTLGVPVLAAQTALNAVIAAAYAENASAQSALNTLKENPRTPFRNSGKFATNDYRGPAMVEVMIDEAAHYGGPRIDADIKALNDRWLTVRNFAEPIAACGPCEADGKLTGLRSHAQNLGVAGPRAIRSARDGALQSIERTEQQLSLSVIEAHRQIEDGLAKNQDDVRQMLIAQGAQGALGLRRDIDQASRQQIEALAGVAATQPAAVAMVSREVEKAAGAASTRAATLALQSAARLRRNIASVSDRHPSAIIRMAERNRASRLEKADTVAREMLTMVASFGGEQNSFIEDALHTVDRSAEQTLFDMAGIPQQVGTSCDGMVAAARKAAQTARSELPPQIGFIAQKLIDACEGLIPISPESTPANPDAAENHGEAAPETLVCTPEDAPNMSTFDPGAMSSTMSSSMSSPMSSAAPMSEAPPEASASGNGERAAAPPPASCSPCETSRTAARDRARAAAPPDTTSAEGSGGETSEVTPNIDAGDDVGVSSNRTDQRSPNSFREHARSISTDATKAPQTDAFLGQVATAVESKIGSQVSNARTALRWNEATDYPKLMGALRGMSVLQAAAVSETYRDRTDRDLARQIEQHAFFGWGAPATKENNRDAALRALQGDINGSAMHELEAAFNWSNETERIFEIMQSMPQDQMTSFVTANRGRLTELLDQLSVEDQARFRLLMDGNAVRVRSMELRTNIDAVNRRHTAPRTSDERGFALNDAIGNAEGATRWAIEGPGDRVDVYGLEDATVRQTREAEHWADIQRDFGSLDGVADAIMRDNPAAAVSRPDDPPGAVLLAYATRPLEVYYNIQVYRREGETRDEAMARQSREYSERFNLTIEERTGPYGPRRVATSSMNEYQLNALEATIRHGARSREARAARALAQFRRSDGKPPDYRDVEAQLHSGIADAREGGNFEHGSLEEADRDRLETFRLMEQHRRRIEGGDTGRISGEDARDVFRREMATAYRDRPQELDVALGVIDSDAGNMQAVIDHAIAREDPALLNRYLGRMDSRQIEAMVTEWNRRHPNGPGLRETLGVGRDNHWSWHNWNGAVFTGDEANTLELAMFGVPQNPQQKGELALRIVDQQIEQSGWMGRLLCNDEYNQLTEHAQHLRETMGVTEGDVDSNGRIRLSTRDGEVFYGNFGSDGQFRPSAGAGATSALNMLSAGSRIVADNYTQAVDNMASMMTTIIAVVGAIVLTVVTFGTAAPLLVAMATAAATAAAFGALTIAVNASMRGGRYSRDDLTRDVVAAAVQVAMAGLNVGIVRGLAAGATMAQGGATAIRAGSLTGRLLVGASKHSLATGMVTQGAMGGLSNLASTALDPAMRRQEDYGDQVMHSFFRGAAGGLMTAGVAHGLNAGGSRLAQRLVVNRTVAAALARGASREAAMRLAASSAARVASGRIMELGVRGLANATSATTGRATEMGYENLVGIRNYGAGDFYRELRHAFVQNAIQGIGEGAALRQSRTMLDSHARQHSETMASERKAAATAAGDAFDAEMTRMGITAAPPEAAPLARPPLSAANDEDALAVRTGDGDARRPGAANDNDGAGGPRPMRTRAALADGEMLRMGRVAEGSVFIHPDTTNLHAANDNFGRLVNADPTREVAVYHNPVTGEYLVIQGDESSVAMIRHDGEIMGPGIRGYPAAALAARGGRWELRSHFHPNRPGQAQTNMARRLPSGQNGDIGVVEAEARHIALLSEDGRGERTSRIYFVDEGKLRYTDFGVRVDGDRVTYTVSYPHPETGIQITPPPFNDIADYHAFFTKETGIEYPVARGRLRGRTADTMGDASLDPARRVGAETARLGDEMTALNRTDAEFVAQRMAQAESFEQARMAGRLHESDIDPTLGRMASTSDAHAWVARMGLVDRPDSMRRLFAVVNDPVLSNSVKEQVLAAVRDATREALIRRGELLPHEPLLLTLHGAPRTRAASIRQDGIDLSKVGSGGSDDFSAGLYFTTELSNALVYAARHEGGGQIFPTILRGRDMGMEVDGRTIRPGTLIDVSPQGPHRAQWEAFVRANMHLLGQAESMNGVRIMELTMEIGRQVFAENPANAGKTPTPRDIFMLGTEHFNARAPFADLDRVGARGVLFDAFLRQMAISSGDPRLARPSMVLGDLGGVLTSGIGYGAQQVLKGGALVDLVNEQLGLGRRSVAGGDDPTALRVRTADEPAPGSQNDPAEIAAKARTGSHVDDINAAQRALSEASPDGARAAIARIRAGGPDAAAAQRHLNSLYGTPKDAVIVNVSDARINRLARGLQPGQSHNVLVEGMWLRLSRAQRTEKTPNPPVRYDASVPPHIPGQPRRIYQFGDGELRVWRGTPTTDEPAGRLIQSSLVGPGRERAGMEDNMFSQGESYERTASTPIGPQAAGYHGTALERGHLHGPGLGVESPFGIGLVPREVNQTLQNRGIEGWMRRLRDALPPGAELIYSTDVSWHPTSNRHSRIGYRLDIVLQGRRVPFAEFAIHIEADPPWTPQAQRRGTTGVFVSPLEFNTSEYPRVDNYFRALREIVDTPEVLHSGLPRAAPTREEIGRTLHQLQPDTIVNMARSAPSWKLASHNPAPSPRFSVRRWESGLNRILGRQRAPRYLVVDLRGQKLTPLQKEQIGRALARLSERDRRRILLLDDRATYSAKMAPQFRQLLLAPLDDDDN